MIIKKISFSVLLFLLIIMFSSYKYYIFCKYQGIKGHVYLLRGNQMPSPDIKPASPAGYQTTVYIYELTNISQVKRQGNSAFYTSIPSKLVKAIKTDKNGAFRVRLKAGEYSLFIKKDTLFYANRFDGKNNIFPVKVETGKCTSLDLKADFDAVY